VVAAGRGTGAVTGSGALSRLGLRRIATSIALLFAVVSGAFVAIHALPGDPIDRMLPPGATPAAAEALSASYGFDRPLPAQYARWLGSALRGDWGRSIRLGQPAMAHLMEGLRNTAFIAVPALLLQLVVGIGLGVVAGQRRGTGSDLAIRAAVVVLYALPIFLWAQIARATLAEQWGLFPAGGMHAPGREGSPLELALHATLPALVLGLAIAAHTARLVRNHLLETYAEDFIRTARAKGASPRRVAWIHALRNTLGPATQSFGITLALLLSGSVIVETIFSWPGLGRRLFLAVDARDFPVVVAGTALTAGLMVVGNALADVLHAAVDPRVRRA